MSKTKTPQQRLDEIQAQRATLEARLSELCEILPLLGEALLIGDDLTKWEALKREAELLPPQLAAAYRLEQSARLDVAALEYDALDAELQRYRGELETAQQAAAQAQHAFNRREIDRVTFATAQATAQTARERWNKQRTALGNVSFHFTASTATQMGLKQARDLHRSQWESALRYEGSVIANAAQNRLQAALLG